MHSYYQHPHSPPIRNPNPIPNPNSVDPQPNPLTQTYASAPPFATSYASCDYSLYPSTFPPPYPHNPDPQHTLRPTDPCYSANPSVHALNPSPQLAPDQQRSYFPSYDPPQPLSVPITNPSLSSNPVHSYPPPPHLASYGRPGGSSVPPAYENLLENSFKFDNFKETIGGYGAYGRKWPGSGSDLRGKRLDDGVYAYDGGKIQPYGARGTSSKSSTWSGFDDYGRSISMPSGKEQGGLTGSPKTVRAIPKVEAQQGVKSGVQKFRVKLLPEGGGQSTMDVLCQIGLDGIRMLDPTSGRTLRIYPLDTLTRCDVTDLSTFTFWAKSSVDIEPRRIRLQSTSYTTNTLLDTVTAATVQLKEMGGRTRPGDSFKEAEQPLDRKAVFGGWMNMLKPANEGKDHWVPDEAITKCTDCGTDFGAFMRRHHCRNCGDIFCNKCTNGRIALTTEENAQPVRVCDRCMAEVTHRLSNAKEATSKPAGFQSHEDLVRKLELEMERNRKASSGSKPDVSGRRMREVACPTCTVHLQVQVPSSGSETIECGVCQSPFLVGTH